MKVADTAVLVDIDRGAAGERVERLDDEGRPVVSSVTVTELHVGVNLKYSGDAREDAADKVDRLLSRFDVHKVGSEVAREAAAIVAELREAGDPLHDLHDVYVAATARTQDLPVLTPNVSHYRRVDEVEVADWNEY